MFWSGITQHILSKQLRKLETDSLISRPVYAEVPPRVEYALMPAALGLAPVMEGLLQWSRQFPKVSACIAGSRASAGSGANPTPLGIF